jgi:hypothetical protein
MAWVWGGGAATPTTTLKRVLLYCPFPWLIGFFLGYRQVKSKKEKNGIRYM